MPEGKKCVAVRGVPPDQTKMGFIMQIENNLFLVSLVGYSKVFMPLPKPHLSLSFSIDISFTHSSICFLSSTYIPSPISGPFPNGLGRIPLLCQTSPPPNSIRSHIQGQTSLQDPSISSYFQREVFLREDGEVPRQLDFDRGFVLFV